MTQYRLTIDKYELGVVVQRTAIDCNTSYTLSEDIPEWVREEVDRDAIITQTVCDPETSDHNPENYTCPGPGIKCMCQDIEGNVE